MTKVSPGHAQMAAALSPSSAPLLISAHHRSPSRSPTKNDNITGLSDVLRDKERRVQQQLERCAEQRGRKMEEQRRRDERRRSAAEERRRQQQEADKERLEALVRRRGGKGGNNNLHNAMNQSGQGQAGELDNRPKRWTWGGPPEGVEDFLAPSDQPINKQLSNSSAALHSPERVSSNNQRLHRSLSNRRSIAAFPEETTKARTPTGDGPTRSASFRGNSKGPATPKRVRSHRSRPQSPCSPGQYPPSPRRHKASTPSTPGTPSTPDAEAKLHSTLERKTKTEGDKKIPKSTSRELNAESPMTPTGRSVGGTTDAEEASRVLAERRRLARIQKEQDERQRLEDERLRAEEEQRQQQERLKRQEQEAREAEEERVQREQQRREKEEEERRQKEQRWKDMQEQLDKDREEAIHRAQEEAERKRQEREEQHIKEEQARQLRKKRIDEIMKRTRKSDVEPPSAVQAFEAKSEAAASVQDVSAISLGPLENKSCVDELSDGVQSMDVSSPSVSISPVSREEHPSTHDFSPVTEADAMGCGSQAGRPINRVESPKARHRNFISNHSNQQKETRRVFQVQVYEMSRQRSHSPNYRSFPWEDPGFDPQNVVDHLDRMPVDQESGNFRRGGSHRKNPGRYEDRGPPNPGRYEDRGTPNPGRYEDREQPHPGRYEERGPPHPGRYEDRGPSYPGRYEDRPPHPEHINNHPQRNPGWRREEPNGEFSERFRDRSPIRQERNQQRGRDRGQQRRRGPSHTDTWIPHNPIVNRNREMDGSPQFGCDWGEPHEQRFAADDRRDQFDRNDGGPKYQQNRNHLMEDRPRREENSPRPKSSRSLSRESQWVLRFEDNRSNDGYQEPEGRRSPVPLPKPNIFSQYTDRPSNRGRPANKGRGFNQRGNFSHRGRGRGAQNRPQQDRETPNQMHRDEFYEEPDPVWDCEKPDRTWRDGRRNQEEERDLQRPDSDPREQRGRKDPKPNMMIITEETMTIKVDMSRPVNKDSSVLYSAAGQPSLDLVHVGRQRLDFLSSAENLGANRANAVQHTGTFAQEIIALTHLVKDLYFGGEGISLNERFSASQTEGRTEDEPHEMTLSERFSSKRLNAHTDNDDGIFMRQGPLQLFGSAFVPDPDDLRHDLEKRRQERLDGVKITIAGSSSQRPLVPSELTCDPSDEVEDDFSNWSEENPTRRGPMTQRGGGGGPFRSNTSYRRNNRQMRRPNYRNNNNGAPNW
uniref:Uncharacterized protein n=1 Tax=Knipowitschia caucasica TaxID=637954 RepID=A0AAV2L288_KNICA